MGSDYDPTSTLKSICAMLGWSNVPPRETLELDLRARRARLEKVESDLAAEKARADKAEEGFDECDAILRVTQAALATKDAEIAALRQRVEELSHCAGCGMETPTNRCESCS